ncbi:phosphatidate cytidylyltransferase [Devosia aurantiaca]|uniref:Phosphatidate cytidylyltransferase n=1 Tax=Devosia aurantiaca TaxID=2714858 RepID=A0A6M1SKP4_9HYPH|nr:phosphatidate cytidylyltransferase [Devosia aurantiaca]NGP17720.1 phosphatidate cytidylyltransferase [Devosia aurantiaca]
MSAPQGQSPEPISAARRSWSDVGTRLASAAVLVALTVAALYFGGYFFAAVVGAVYAGAYREWETMVSRAPLTPRGMVIIGLVAISGLLYPVFGLAGLAAAIAVALVVAATMGREDFCGGPQASCCSAC